jgi:hypothetical protein
MEHKNSEIDFWDSPDIKPPVGWVVLLLYSDTILKIIEL